MNDDFYIGYADRAPAGLARRVRVWVALLAVALVLVAAGVAAVQRPFGGGRFEFGVTREWEGVLLAAPLPMLQAGDGAGVTNHVLVGPGKRGVAGAADWHGRRVRVAGSLIERAGQRMIEVHAITAAAGPAAVPPAAGSAPGAEVTLTGELVDTKCWFGVMRPGSGKVHRACAARCLSGGVPPGLLVRDADGGGLVVLLVPAAGARLEPAWAGLPITVAGRLERQGGLAVVTFHSAAPAAAQGHASALE
ncbi:MAG: hypothetical protein ACKVYV_09900 [Limisphaerales bacterium]